MSDASEPPERKLELNAEESNNLELVVCNNLKPKEKLIRLCRENLRPNLRFGIFSHQLIVLNIVALRSRDASCSPATLHQVLCDDLLVVTIALAIAYALGTHLEGIRLELLLVGALLFSYLIILRRMVSQVFAITNQRLICLSLPRKKTLWWLNLDRSTSIEIENLQKGIGDLHFHFSEFPTGVSGQELKFKDFVLKGIDKPGLIRDAFLDSN